VNPQTEARLSNLQIQLVSQTADRFVFARGNCIALAEIGASGFPSIGSTGFLGERGLAYLIWRNGRAMLAGKGSEVDAQADQIVAIQQFSKDLKSALCG
jgi:hypothetical protein